MSRQISKHQGGRRTWPARARRKSPAGPHRDFRSTLPGAVQPVHPVEKMERAMRFELTTLTLARKRLSNFSFQNNGLEYLCFLNSARY